MSTQLDKLRSGVTKGNAIDQKVRYVVGQLEEKFTRDGMTDEKIICMVVHSMVTLSAFVSLKGSDKKAATILAVKNFVSSIEDAKTKDDALSRVDTMAPGLIDSLYLVANEKIKFNKHNNWCLDTWFFRSFCCCFGWIGCIPTDPA
jgi:hypothetical protein